MPRSDGLQRSLLALVVNPMPQAVRSALLANRQFCEKFELAPEFWLPLDQELAVETTSLHGALCKAIAGRKTAKLILRDGRGLHVKLGRDKQGQATIRLKQKAFSFPDTDLLSKGAGQRAAALTRAFEERPLRAEEEDCWRSKVAQGVLGNVEYVDFLTSVGLTPEAVHIELGKPQNLGPERLMPDAPEYYHRLIAPLAESRTLEAYAKNELAAAYRTLLERHPTPALRRIAFAALWQPLVPFELCESLDVEDVRKLLEAEDPFSLLCGFELCRHLLPKDQAFASLGTAFLKKLLEGDAAVARCNIFSACALISSIHIRRAAKAWDAPVFWTRLAALAHAGVLADSLAGIEKTAEFLQWSVDHFSAIYVWHGAIDRREAPRWNPEWIDPEHLYAELAGRAGGALGMLPLESRPAEWVEAIDLALGRLQTSGRFVTAFFVGPFDDFREGPQPGFAPQVFEEIEAKLESAAKLDEVPQLSVLISTILPSERVEARLKTILGQPVDEPISSGAQMPYLRTCAAVAASTRSEALAGLVINRCLFLARAANPTEGVTNLFNTAVEACAAHADEHQYRKAIGDAAAALCFGLTRPEDLSNLDPIFDVLESRDEKLMPALSRARAIVSTKLGRI